VNRENTTTVSNTPTKVFRTRPGQDFIDEFLAHVRETGRPETFPGLHPGPIANTEPFFTLKPFSIDRKKRPPRNKAPCPMCQPNKYLNGSLSYFPQLEAVAAVGHCCAAKENREAASREYRQRTLRDEQETYLLAHIPLVPDFLSVIQRTRPAASEARRIYRHFRKRGVEFHRELHPIKMVNGRLSVSEQIEGEIAAVGPAGFRSPGSRVNIREIEFGTLGGMIALNRDYNPVGELDRIESRLRPHNHAKNEDDILEYITAMTPQIRLATTVQLREARNHYSKFQARMANFCAFFAPENLGRIHNWASHPARPERFQVSLTGNRCTFRSRLSACVIVLDPILWTYDYPWPEPQPS
jgi:hypothetical protein